MISITFAFNKIGYASKASDLLIPMHQIKSVIGCHRYYFNSNLITLAPKKENEIFPNKALASVMAPISLACFHPNLLMLLQSSVNDLLPFSAFDIPTAPVAPILLLLSPA